jgi:hypothetical protein
LTGTILVLGAFGVVLAGVESRVFDLERHQLPKALVLHLTALALLVSGSIGRRPRAWSAVEVLVVGFVVLGIPSTALATNRWLALGSWGLGFSGAVVLLGAGSILDERWRSRALGWILAAVVLGAALGVAQAYGWDAAWLARGRAPGGTFGNRNFLAHVSAIAAPPLLVIGLAPGPTRRRTLALLGLGVVLLAVVLTRSRAGWLGAGLALALAGAGVLRVRGVDGQRRLAGTGRALLVGSVAVAAAVGLPNALEWRDESPYVGTLTRLTDFRAGSGRGRLIQYRNSLELVQRHPVLGVGPGNWFVHYPTVTEAGDPAYGGHLSIPTNPWPSSDWVATTTERGLPGALLLLAAGFVALATSLYRTGLGGDAGLRGAAAAGVVVAAAVTGLFDAVLLLPTPALVVAALLGLLLPRRPRSAVGERGARARRAALVATAGTAVLVTGFTAVHTLAVRTTADSMDSAVLERAARRAPWDHRLRLMLAERGQCDDARAAAALMPFHTRPRELLRDCVN